MDVAQLIPIWISVVPCWVSTLFTMYGNILIVK